MNALSAEDNGLPRGEGFTISPMITMPLGSNDVGVWLSGTIHVGLSDTLDMNVDGIGIVENQLSPEDLRQAREIHSKLCSAATDETSRDFPTNPPAMHYSVTCLNQGALKSYQGKLDELPRDLAFQLFDYRVMALSRYVESGRAIVKLDLAVREVRREKDKFFVSVKFTNNGRYTIRMSTPDVWSRQYGDSLSVWGKAVDGTEKWGIQLAGLALVNKADFNSDTVTLPARGTVVFDFRALPDTKIKRGTYDVNAIAITDLDGDGLAATMARVDFRSDRGKAALVTFDHDYPSTPEERENFEAQKREAMSSQPFYPGSTFIEEGYYRAVSDSGQRSRFVNRFYRNDPVPEVKNMVDGLGQPLHGKHLGWTWEAGPPADVYAFETQCKPGKVCPRTGHWFARIEWDMTTYPPEYDDSLGEIIHCRQGQLMPASRKASGQVRNDVRWEWIGV
ncbi:hypothetical protein [Paraburkholderia solisilvae]|uniref:Uncharacterized protein n=1 Tax=Paraburkholderia solisilvae TaxID=624376 RepID=A0A6J5DYV5_9BURK|nr:hypothetical protein [Paraburkholderia solisilvae]CAB3758877.1 hypothetical protein LMG29739_03014 [Paraburkholderia solisilvae]